MAQVGPDGYRAFYQALAASGVTPHIVAGQAVNLWAQIYRQREPELNQFLPFVSGDLELFMGGIGDGLIASLPEAEVRRAAPFGRVSSPDNTTVSYVDGEERRTISLMHGLIGLSQEEIRRRAVDIRIFGITIKVMDPVALAKAKASNLISLDQSRRQDLKHLRMVVLCCREFTHDILIREGARAALNVIERIIELSQSRVGVKVQQSYGIDWTDCVPWTRLEEARNTEPKLSNFLSRRAPQWRETRANS